MALINSLSRMAGTHTEMRSQGVEEIAPWIKCFLRKDGDQSLGSYYSCKNCAGVMTTGNLSTQEAAQGSPGLAS